MPRVPPHLTIGSKRPPLVEGKLRLYSMEYCPFAQRSRLVLLAKKIPHDIVNINLINRPEWYFDINPKGLVPAIETKSEIVVESLDISDWLEEKYPENPLYPSDAAAKQLDKDVIGKIEPLVSAHYRNLINADGKTPEEVLKDLAPSLDVFEKELASRGGVFFGGDKPSLVDYTLWPTGERFGTLKISLGTKVLFEPDQYPLLRRWKKAMRQDPFCDETYHGPEKFWKIIEYKLKKLKPDYDSHL